MKPRVCLVDIPYRLLVNRDMYSSVISKGLYKWPAADLLVLSGILKEITGQIFILDANILGLTHGEALRKIIEFGPTHIIFMSGSSVLKNDLQFIKSLKEHLPHVKTIGSGGLLYYNSRNTMQLNPQIDAVIRNFTTRDINRYIKNDYSNIRNFTYRNGNGEITEAEFDSQRDPFYFPLPMHEAFPLKKYRLSHAKAIPITSIISSYGCPSRCSYCVSEKIDYRARDIENVIEELKYVKSLGVKTIFFRDPTFLADKKLGIQLLMRMIEERLNLSWVADTQATCVTEETMPLIAKSGGHCLHIGVESASPEILKEYSKGLTHENIQRAFKLCKKYKIRTVGYFILGLPGETRDSLKNTITLSKELDCDYASFNMPTPIVGTAFRQKALDNKWLYGREDYEYDGLYNTLLETPYLSSKEIKQYLIRAKLAFYFRPSYFLKRIKSLRSFCELRLVLREFLKLGFDIFRNLTHLNSNPL